MKYYAVYKGKSVIPKIYTSWDECKKDVIGFKGAIYKSFTTEKEAKELGQKMMENDFTYDDYLTAMEQMKKLGSLSKIIDMIPGVPKEMKEIDFDAGEKQLSRVKAIIYSMTAKERKNPKLIVGSSSRKKRIAMGSGTSLQEVNKLIKGHEMMRKQMRQMKSLTKKSKKGLFGKLPF